MAESAQAIKATRLKKSGKNREVYLIEDKRNRRSVVLKLYTADRHAKHECEALSICHDDPHFVQLLDCHAGDDYSYVIMEHVEGETVANLLKRQVLLPPRKVIDLAIDILTGLQAMHERGIVHGDLQGRNVIITDFEQAQTKIIDLQHAVKMKQSSGKAKAIRKTPKDHVMFPPEGKTGILDQRYDLYSVGYMCACLLTGVKWDVEPPGALAKLDQRPLAPQLWKIVQKAMQKDPELRYSSAAEMIRALRAL